MLGPYLNLTHVFYASGSTIVTGLDGTPQQFEINQWQSAGAYFSTSYTKFGANEEFATGVTPVQVPSRRPESFLGSIVLFVFHGHLVAQCTVDQRRDN